MSLFRINDHFSLSLHVVYMNSIAKCHNAKQHCTVTLISTHDQNLGASHLDC